ncbi:SMI1/KNR4 family protein [Luteibacter sp. 22Crub2.1]|uniref:SMI1/KNR4 family protein n=1 Tax=Luteibacter sp. 22Crub2.1 TaxID=1283288 RepID=UPI0009A7743B|nr:SMI1/KNR4 family protein [Luteibacter sp. 22Crub2.1]
MDWKRELVIAHLVKAKIAEADRDGLWPNTLPRVGASPETIHSAEQILGRGFSSSHKEFLLCADGWEGFYQRVDILGTADYANGTRLARGHMLLGASEDPNFSVEWRRSLLPVAVSSVDIDVFAMAPETVDEPGVIYWFAGRLVDRFSDFEEWFLAMVDYNREEFRDLSGGSLSFEQ